MMRHRDAGASLGYAPMRPLRRRRLSAGLVAVACAAVLGACADKDFTPPQAAFSPNIALQITTTGAQQQAAFGPRWLLVAAGFDGETNAGGDDGDLLALRVFPYTAGTQRVTLPVDISRCLAYFAARGRSVCPLLVAAAIVDDTAALADTAGGDIFTESFDFRVLGPFEVGPGRTPTIPAIDLSASRFGVIRWRADDALRIGGASVPLTMGPITGVPGAGGSAALVMPTSGSISTSPTQPLQGPFPQLAILENGQWRRVTNTLSAQTPGAFTAVTAFALNDMYASHRTGLFRYDGSGFSRITTIGDSLYSMGSVTVGGTTKLVITGGVGIVWIGNTQTWTRYSLGTSERLDGVCITGPAEAFASSTNGGLWRFNGTSWTSVPAPTATSKFALQCPAPGQAFVMSQGAAGGLFRWTGSSWTTMPTTGLNLGRLVTWGVVSATEAYAWGDSAQIDRAFYRFNGTTWTEVGRRRFTQGGGLVNGAMWADPRGGAAYVATPFGRVERVTPSGVAVISYQPAVRDISMSSPSNAFVVGWNLFLARWDGVRWTVDEPPPATPTVRILQGVWTDGPNNAWAVGGANTILRYDGKAWSVVSDIFKPAAAPDAYNAVWGSGANVWAVGNTIARCTAAGTCVNESGGVGTLYGIWGTSGAGAIFAVGANGRIIRSVSGGSWQAMVSPTTKTLVRVSGTGPNDVWAVGDGVLLRYDGTEWKTVPITDDLRFFLGRTSATPSVLQLGLWARTPTEVYVGGEFGGVARWDGQSWTEVTPRLSFGRRTLGITGAPAGCALALGDGQTDGPGDMLFRGIGPSGCFISPMTSPTSWP